MLALDYIHQGQPFDRLETRSLVCELHAQGVTLALSDGHIAVTIEKPPLSEEARMLLKENKEALLTYLTTPPEDTRECGNCERPVQWVLDWMAIWVCSCYYRPELRTLPADPAQIRAADVTIEKKTSQPGLAVEKIAAAAAALFQETGPRPLEIERMTSRDRDQGQPALADQVEGWPAEGDMVGIGVLTEDSLYFWHPGAQDSQVKQLARAVKNVEDMFLLACQYRLHSLWLCPGNPLCLTYKDQPDLFAPLDLEDRYKVNVRHKEKSTLPTSATIYPKSGPRGHRPMVRVLLPDFDSTWLEEPDDLANTWAFSDVEDPRLFLETLILIFERLGVYLATSPAQTGIDSMQQFTRPGDWTHTEAEIALPHFEELDIHWKQELTSEHIGWYLHKYDGNSKYLASATGADKGTGTPDQLNEEEAVSAFSRGSMGIWDVTIKEPAEWPVIDGVDTARLPHRDTWTGRRLLTTPGLKSYIALGYDHAIHQGRVWFNEKGRADIGKRRVLKDWASFLFKTRQELKAQYGKKHPAYKLIKMIANRSLGWLDLARVRTRIEKGCAVKDVPWYFAPYYYQEIKGLTRWRMVLKILDLVKEEDAYPVLVFTDCVGLFSKEPDPRRAFPKLLTREEELGGFKHAGSILVTADVVEAFSQEHAASDTLHQLKVIEREAHNG